MIFFFKKSTCLKKNSSFAKFKSSSSIKQSLLEVLSTGDARLGLLLAGSLDCCLIPLFSRWKKKKYCLSHSGLHKQYVARYRWFSKMPRLISKSLSTKRTIGPTLGKTRERNQKPVRGHRLHLHHCWWWPTANTFLLVQHKPSLSTDPQLFYWELSLKKQFIVLRQKTYFLCWMP